MTIFGVQQLYSAWQSDPNRYRPYTCPRKDPKNDNHISNAFMANLPYVSQWHSPVIHVGSRIVN
jgi:hypothetical protein